MNPSSRNIEGLFGLTQRPSRDLNIALYVASELQIYKDIVRYVVLRPDVPGHHGKQWSQTVAACLQKTHFFTLIFDNVS